VNSPLALRTQSPVAARVLRDWDAHLERFLKVMPHDYKRALAEISLKAMTALGEIREIKRIPYRRWAEDPAIGERLRDV